MCRLSLRSLCFAVIFLGACAAVFSQSTQRSDSSQTHEQVVQDSNLGQTSLPADSSGASSSTALQDSGVAATPADSLVSPRSAGNTSSFPWALHMAWIVPALGLLLGAYRYWRKERGHFRWSRAVQERHYRSALDRELRSIKILGSPEIESIPVSLLDAFVSLDLSQTWRSEQRFESEQGDTPIETTDEGYLSADKVLQWAFSRQNLLLIVGDPGCGKTTLIKFYAMTCLRTNGHKMLGFSKPVLPLYFPLRELEPKEKRPAPLPENLARWSKQHILEIPESTFKSWLHERDTLVLLDGLDEIADVEQRRRVCDWIDDTVNGLSRVRFVVTSRWTGYRKADGVELGCNHIRADVRDFTPGQQEQFLRKWFHAVHTRDYTGDGSPPRDWREKQALLAEKRVEKIIEFLQDEKNESLRRLAAVPLLLQIMAILWKEREVQVRNRAELYNASLNYLLDYRDKRRGLSPLLPAREARRVLGPVALWMQASIGKDEAPRSSVHEQMQPILDTMKPQRPAADFCKNLIDRAGLLVAYGEDDYLFRHKSFREYLAGVQLQEERKLRPLIAHFGEDWWEEPLRFFMGEVNDAVFDKFMDRFFRSPKSHSLDQKEQDLLQTIIRDAPQHKIDSLAKHLQAAEKNGNRIRYILESLRTIGTDEALSTVEKFTDHALSEDVPHLSYAREIVATARGVEFYYKKSLAASIAELKVREAVPEAEILRTRPVSFRNPYEQNAEYILIPKGEFTYSVSKALETVPALYFAKYPLTNRLYRRFIAFLRGQPPDLTERLPRELFKDRLWTFAEQTPGFGKVLGTDSDLWEAALRSKYDDNKRFNQEEQPVVGVSWFAARAYCFWLSCLEWVSEDAILEDMDFLARLYRLPAEPEWEWAAAGREKDGSLRRYPWPKDRGEPTDKLANFGGNVGATTPVGRYPDGATPEGLMDMAGNVREWMQNWASDSKKRRALRGGSWNAAAGDLLCSDRDYYFPGHGDANVGFRVLRQSGSE